ncbi:MAG TPA: MFS transporter [Candidatus Paceibacterota bacterium]|nr:MFS transporter [Candidatus Paceibacterota bacterium]
MAPETNTNTPPKDRNVFYVGLLSFFGGISQDVFSPILPIYLTTVLGFDKAFIGVAEGVVTASANIFKVIAGYFSDRFKKQKPIIFLGYAFSMVARPLLVFFTSGAAVLGLRLLDGTGKGIKDPAKDVLIAGSADKKTRGRSFGVARMLDTMGSVAGPLLLFGLLYLFQNSLTLYHNILLFTAVPLVITLGVLVLKVREAPKVERPAVAAPKAIGGLPSTFYLFLVIVVIFTLGNSSDAFLVLRAKNLGVTLLEIPLVIALFNLVYALAAVPFGSLSDRIGRIPTMLIGWTAYAAVYLGFGLASSASAAWALYAFYGIYYATNEGVSKALLADIVGSDHRGRAFGLYGTTIGIAAIPASFFAGYLWDKFGPQAPFFFGAALAGTAALLLLLFSRRIKTA